MLLQFEVRHLNTEVIKYGLMVVSAPFWVPLLRRLWRQVNFALREEGGVLGRAPTPAELEQLRQAKRAEQDPLVNEPLAFGRPLGGASRAPQSPASTALRPGGVAAPRPRFRDDARRGGGAFR